MGENGRGENINKIVNVFGLIFINNYNFPFLLNAVPKIQASSKKYGNRY